MKKQLLIINFLLVFKLYSMDADENSFILFTPKKPLMESRDGLVILNDFKTALLNDNANIQNSRLKELEFFMEEEFKNLHGNAREQFKEKFFQIVTISPSQKSIPFDFNNLSIEKGIFTSPVNLSDPITFSDNKNEKNKVGQKKLFLRSKSIANLNEKFEKLNNQSSEPNSFLTKNSFINQQSTKSSPSLLELMKKSKSQPTSPSSSFLNHNPPPLNVEPFKNQSDANQTQADIIEFVCNPLFLNWLRAYQNHSSTIRKKLNTILCQEFNTTLVEIERKKNTAAILKVMNIKTKEEHEKIEQKITEKNTQFKKKFANND